MRHLRNLRFLALTGAMFAIAGGLTPARAQDPDDLKRAVARISLMNGEVSVRRGDSGDWVAGVINAPLMTGDNVATGPNSRAEVQFDASNVLRLGANGDLRLTQLEYGRLQMELAKGVVTYRSLRAAESNVEIDTPSLSVRPTRQGSFRITVNEAGETEVTARGGEVEVFTPHGSQWVRNGQTLLARGSSTDAEFQVVNAGGMDEWDRWCDGRDRMITQSTSSRYVGQGVYGTEDLDSAGTWNNTPDYGYVWRPSVGADWAPYQSGRWVWEDWYGWTWVSSDPWGWAPYHYGRWYRDGRLGWCWYPGSISARHYWSPALVGFFGFGRGVGIGVGFGYGNIGWVPLAPFEVFHPWWGRGYYGSGGYSNRSINITNVNITNNYRNARYENGVHGVGAADFQNGRFNNVTHMNGSQIQNAGAINGRMPFTGGAQNMRFTDRQVGAVPQTNGNTRFFRQQTPNPVGRSTVGQSGAVRGQGPAAGNQVGGAVRGQAAAQGTGDNGWRRFGTPAGQGAGNQSGSAGTAARSERPAASSQGGWQRFGTPAGGSSGQGTAAPRQNGNPGQSGRQFGSSGNSGSGQQSLRIAPPVVRERSGGQTYGSPAPRQNSPSYNAPRQSAPSYSAPRQSAPTYSAPRQSAPSYSAPRSNGGGGNPSGGGNSRPSGGGSGNRGGRSR